MAQFDPLIIFPLLWSTLFILMLYYNTSIELLVPSFFGTKKFREIKLGLSKFYIFWFITWNSLEFKFINDSFDWIVVILTFINKKECMFMGY